MDNKIVLMVVVAIVLGMLVANMFKDVCGCKVVEGQCTAGSNGLDGGSICHPQPNADASCLNDINAASDESYTTINDACQWYCSEEPDDNICQTCCTDSPPPPPPPPTQPPQQPAPLPPPPPTQHSSTSTIYLDDNGCMVISDSTDTDGSASSSGH